MNRLLTCGAAALLLVACSSGSRRVDPDVDDELGGTGYESGDVRQISDWMVRSLQTRLPRAADGSAPRIVIGDVQNETRFMIDKDLFVKRMRVELNKQAMGRLTFLAREDLAAVEAERKAKREGQVTGTGQKALLGADYLLTGTLSGLSKAREGDRSDYLLSTFRLTDLESSAIVWEDSHEMKRVGEAGVLYK